MTILSSSLEHVKILMGQLGFVTELFGQLDTLRCKCYPEYPQKQGTNFAPR